MDPRETNQHNNHNQLQPPPGMLMSSFNLNPNAAALMGPTTTSQAMHHLLPFGSIPPHLYPHPHNLIDHKPLIFDGSPSSVAIQQQQQSMMRFAIEEQQQQQQQEKRKRGRPRKYAPDGNNIGLALAPTSPLPSGSNSHGGDSGGGGGENTNSADPPAKRSRGRPLGSGKKQLEALGGARGIGFTPHVIDVKTGEDIAMKVMEFTNQGPRAICILSARGSVSSVLLRQANDPNGIVNCEGVFEIISMSGSFLNSESDVTKSGTLSVSLGRPNGHVFGGCVAGNLVAGSEVQVIVGSFVLDGKKQKKQSAEHAENSPEPASTPANMSSFGGGGGPGSPRSQGQQQQQSSESSEENESNSPLNRGDSNNNNNNNNHGLFGNSTPQQRLQQMPGQMYQHLWPGRG